MSPTLNSAWLSMVRALRGAFYAALTVRADRLG